jgi:Family of unknown function (DUF6029)
MKHINLKSFSTRTASAVLLFLFLTNHSNAQLGNVDLGTISGNFQIDGQYYREDSAIGAPNYPAAIGSNSFVNLLYNRGKFTAGVRYEAYLPTLQGFTRQTGSGITYRFARYSHEKFDITVGTFYEQFGAGLTLRTWESWGLGFDNSMDGIRGKFMPAKGVTLTGLIGRQRNAFSTSIANLSEGIVRGFDANVSIQEAITKWNDHKTRITVGGSFVSRYQEDSDPIYILPENVATAAGRATVTRGKVSLSAEYSTKINDPSAVNNLIYKKGDGLLIQGSYSQKGLGVSLTAKRIDNMDYRSDRNAAGNNLTTNYLPPLTKQHTYRLATLFPYATQPLGEIGFQAEISYKIKKETKIGGKYGTQLTLNVSRVQGLETTPTPDPTLGYTSNFFGFGGPLYIQDINFEISRKFSKRFKASTSHFFFKYDEFLFKQLTGFNTTETVNAMVNVVELNYVTKPKHNLHVELQHCYTKQEFGSWAMLGIEYSIAPHWFVSAFDEYNYGNEEEGKRIHYFSGTVGYLLDNYRFTLGYGRQRAGVLCVGGVCRLVPASNGITLTINGSF